MPPPSAMSHHHARNVHAPISAATQEKAANTKAAIEEKYAQMRRDQEANEERRTEMESKMTDLQLTDDEKAKWRRELRRQERQEMMQQRKRLSTNDFESMAVVGRGAFGTVRLVRKKDTGDVYALKSMIKDAMVIKNQVSHVRAERDVMAESETPWMVQLHYSFQDEVHLHLVMDYMPGGDLMSLLMK